MASSRRVSGCPVLRFYLNPALRPLFGQATGGRDRLHDVIPGSTRYMPGLCTSPYTVEHFHARRHDYLWYRSVNSSLCSALDPPETRLPGEAE